MTTDARRMHQALEPYHGMIYFAPEGMEEYAALGLDDRMMGYFASRSAAMGAVTAETVIATFFNFNPALVRSAIPEAWKRTTPAEVLAARLRAADRALTRMLGDRLHAPDIAEAAQLARRATEACRAEGHPLYAAHAALAWPEPPHLALWHALTLLREYRGDGHIAMLVEQDVSAPESLVLHGAMGVVPGKVLKSSRQWSDEDWQSTVDGLVARGWLEPDGTFTAEGKAHRDLVERRTDELAEPCWALLSGDERDRLAAIGGELSGAIVASGAFGRQR